MEESINHLLFQDECMIRDYQAVQYTWFLRRKQRKILNNIIEQDHRFIKKQVHFMLGLKSFLTAKKILSDVEAMHMLRKKLVFLREKSVQNQKEFI